MSVLDEAARRTLLDTAAASIRAGLDRGTPLLPDVERHVQALRADGASFVTLRRGGELRGCIGTLEPRRPLVEDVADNAYAAAFRDPRFPPLEPGEIDGLDVHVSVIGPCEAIDCRNETDLLRELRPGIDGLVIEDAGRRATFLPSVWDGLPRPRDFLEQLRRKAGLPPGHWSPTFRAWRYTTESFS